MTTPADTATTTADKLSQLGQLLDDYLGEDAAATKDGLNGLALFGQARRFGKDGSNLWTALWLADPSAATELQKGALLELRERALGGLVKFMHEAWPECKAKQGGPKALKTLPADGGVGVAADLAARRDRATVRGGGGGSSTPAAVGPWREDTVYEALTYLLFRSGSVVSSIRETADASTLGGFIHVGRDVEEEGGGRRNEEAWKVLAACAMRLGQWLEEQVRVFPPLRRMLALMHERDEFVLDTARAAASMGFLEGSLAATRHAAAEWDKAAAVWIGVADKTIPRGEAACVDVVSVLAMRVWGWRPCDEGVNDDGECADLESVEDMVRSLRHVLLTASDAEVRAAAEAGFAAKRCAQCSMGFLLPCHVPEHETGTVWADVYSRLFGAVDPKNKKRWRASDLVDTIALKTQGTPFVGSALALENFVRKTLAQ